MIKSIVRKKQLPLKYQQYSLIETIDGHTNSVYLMGDKYILKIFEDNNYNIDAEIELLKNIRELNVSQIVEHFYISKKLYIVYTQVPGKTIYHPKLLHIKQISIFLKKLHKITRNKYLNNNIVYTKNYLQKIMKNCKDDRLLNIFSNIKLELKNDGIIHGDIFCDNVKFLNDKLSGVYDFNEACNGDFLFDLAVIAFSWCFDGDKLNRHKLATLIENYDNTIDLKEFYEYIKYALLYYSATRSLTNRDYQDLLNKMDNLNG